MKGIKLTHQGTGCYFPSFKEIAEGQVIPWGLGFRVKGGRWVAQRQSATPATAPADSPLNNRLGQGEHIAAIEERTEETRMFRSFAGGYRK